MTTYRFTLCRGLSWLAVLASIGSTTARAADWITAPSYFTHDPRTGKRVAQYSPIGPVYTYQRADFVESGFHHYRSSIRYGGTADNYFRVKEWGRPVRPFGEWQFPYRPYSVPFPLWNTPYYGMYQFYGGYPAPYPYPAPFPGPGPGPGPGP